MARSSAAGNESCLLTLGEFPALSSVYFEESRKMLILEPVMEDQGRLRNFIRKRVPDRQDLEDVLQDAFFELVAAYRLMKPIEEVGDCGDFVPSHSRLVS
jgi:hypothetical protein